MSANPLTESGGKYSYDFSSGETQVYGGTTGHKQLSPGNWGLFGGNGVHDNNHVNENDKTTIWSVEAGSSGYLNGDYNMDSQTDNSDKNDIWINNAGNSSQIPD